MSHTRVASRYAKSIIDLSIELKKLDEVKADFDLIGGALEESRDLRVMLQSPVVKPDVKQRILKEVFASHVQEVTSKFIHLLVDHGREGILKEVITNFNLRYLKVKGIVHATVTSTVALDDAARKRVVALIGQLSNLQVELEECVDPELIGGFVLQVGDQKIDASVAGSLNKLKRQFKDNHYVADF